MADTLPLSCLSLRILGCCWSLLWWILCCPCCANLGGYFATKIAMVPMADALPPRSSGLLSSGCFAADVSGLTCRLPWVDAFCHECYGLPVGNRCVDVFVIARLVCLGVGGLILLFMRVPSPLLFLLLLLVLGCLPLLVN